MNTKHSIQAKAFDKHGRLLSSASNSYTKTHPIQAMFAKKAGMEAKQYLHAEIACIIRSKGAKIYSLHVSRETKSGNLRNAKPCPVCLEAIKAYGVRYVFYTDNSGCVVQLNMEE